MRQRRKARRGERQTIGKALRAADEAMGRLVSRLAAMERRAREKLRQDGWEFETHRSRPRIFSFALLPSAPRSAIADETLGPETEGYTRADYEFRRYAVAYPMTIPICALPLARKLGAAFGYLRVSPFAEMRARRAARDPGAARRALVARGWTNREVRRLPISLLGKMAAAFEPVVVGFEVEATFLLAPVNGRKVVMVHESTAPAGLFGVLVRDAIEQGADFRIA